jgi:hypothetical protein
MCALPMLPVFLLAHYATKAARDESVKKLDRFATVEVSDVCLCPRNRARIFRGGVRTLQDYRFIPRPTTTQLFANGSPLA